MAYTKTTLGHFQHVNSTKNQIPGLGTFPGIFKCTSLGTIPKNMEYPIFQGFTKDKIK